MASQLVARPLVDHPGPYLAQKSPEPGAARTRMCDSLCPEGVETFEQWGRTMIKFGEVVKGRSYKSVCFSEEKADIAYLKWARSHLVEPSCSALAADFAKYLAVKDKYHGRSDKNQSSVVYMPGSSIIRTYVV